jgi:hypothetical protein
LRLSLLLLIALGQPCAAAEISLRPFNASYNLYKGGMHIAITELKLERAGEHWRWSSLTKARGIYAWFTDKQPYTETSFNQVDNEVRLREILVADRGKNGRFESARFDWAKGEIDVLRKGKRRQVQLVDPVYDYQSIHLLAATMGQKQLTRATLDFYRKGKLVKSRFVYSGQGRVDVNGSSIDANVYEQMIVKSNSKIKYYYDADNPLLPLRIEKLESGESPAILTLHQVDWGL